MSGRSRLASVDPRTSGSLWRSWRPRVTTSLTRLARAAGVDVVAHNYYSPVPAGQDLPHDVFERSSALAGISFDLDAHVAFLRTLEPLLAEFEVPAGFTWDNRMYGGVEADVLYALVRSQRPRRIIELGSGFSSLIIAAAARQNAASGSEVTYTAYDPYARDFIRRGLEPLTLRDQSAADIPVETFQSLGERDLLFIDTSHTVKLGGEVNHVILDVLPTLASGVIVHVHDIFLPWEYPKEFFENRLYWTEQYLLQAFLCQNQCWEVLLPLCALVRRRPTEVAKLVRSFQPGVGPSAFWMRRT